MDPGVPFTKHSMTELAKISRVRRRSPRGLGGIDGGGGGGGGGGAYYISGNLGTAKILVSQTS